MILLYSLILLISFYLLAKICDDFFVESLEEIAQKLKLSPEAAGATLMAMGSSAPELFVAFFAVFGPGDHAAVGMGTIVGSALFNILVIIGVSAMIHRSALAWQVVVRDTLFYTVSIILLLWFFRDAQVTFNEAAVLTGVYVFYVIAVTKWKKWFAYKSKDEPFEEEDFEIKKKKWIDVVLEKIFPRKENYWGIFLMAIALIAGFSWVLVESAVGLAEELNIPAAIVALTVLAAGTSVPDLISSIIVARKGKGGMAISNAIGSNVFDILFGLGVPWVIMLAINGDKFIPVETENLVSSVILLFATVIVIFFLLFMRRWQIGKKSGYFLIFLYFLYIIWAVGNVV